MSRPFIPAPNCASIELIYSNVGETNENVLHVQKGSPYSLADLSALRALVNTWDLSTWSNWRSSNASLYRIRTKALDTASSPIEDYYLPSPRVGTPGIGQATLSSAYAVKLATGRAGRSYRGRIYVGNLYGGFISDAGHVTTAFSNGVVAALNTLRTTLAGSGHTLVVVSYRADKAWRAVAEVTAITGAVAVDLNLDSQRRRLPGRGRP